MSSPSVGVPPRSPQGRGQAPVLQESSRECSMNSSCPVSITGEVCTSLGFPARTQGWLTEAEGGDWGAPAPANLLLQGAPGDNACSSPFLL